MGKRTVEAEVVATEEQDLYFCDDCGEPHDEDDLSRYRNGTSTLHFCGECENRFEETSAMHTGAAPSPSSGEKATDSVISVFAKWWLWALGMYSLAVLGMAAGAAGGAMFCFGVATTLFIVKSWIPVTRKKVRADPILGRLWE